VPENSAEIQVVPYHPVEPGSLNTQELELLASASTASQRACKRSFMWAQACSLETPIEPGKHAELNDPEEIGAWVAKLHARLIEGCPAAREQLVVFLLHLLSRQLTARFPAVDRDLIHDAVVLEIMGYLDNPDAFDAAKGLTIAALLGSGARQRLCNSLGRATRRQKREAAWQEQRLQKNIFELRASAQQYTLEHWNNSRLRPCEPSVASQSGSAWRF
jgi:hypothetical protein